MCKRCKAGVRNVNQLSPKPPNHHSTADRKKAWGTSWRLAASGWGLHLGCQSAQPLGMRMHTHTHTAMLHKVYMLQTQHVTLK